MSLLTKILRAGEGRTLEQLEARGAERSTPATSRSEIGLDRDDAVADNAGMRYTFRADIDANGFRVPAVYPTIQAAVDEWEGG